MFTVLSIFFSESRVHNQIKGWFPIEFRVVLASPQEDTNIIILHAHDIVSLVSIKASKHNGILNKFKLLPTDFILPQCIKLKCPQLVYDLDLLVKLNLQALQRVEVSPDTLDNLFLTAHDVLVHLLLIFFQFLLWFKVYHAHIQLVRNVLTHFSKGNL